MNTSQGKAEDSKRHESDTSSTKTNQTRCIVEAILEYSRDAESSLKFIQRLPQKEFEKFQSGFKQMEKARDLDIIINDTKEAFSSLSWINTFVIHEFEGSKTYPRYGQTAYSANFKFEIANTSCRIQVNVTESYGEREFSEFSVVIGNESFWVGEKTFSEAAEENIDSFFNLSSQLKLKTDPFRKQFMTVVDFCLSKKLKFDDDNVMGNCQFDDLLADQEMKDEGDY